MDRLDELRGAVQSDPRAVAAEASQLVAQARVGGDAAGLSRSLGLLGRARRALGDVGVAESDLSGAIAAGLAAGDDELVADARIGLAGVLMFAGRFDEAFAHLDEADRLGSERLRAYAALQRATLAVKLGRMPEALTAYDAGLPVLRALGARSDVAIVLMNRGVIRGQSAEFDAALADLAEAGNLFAATGSRYGVAQVRHGIGWVHARRGDLVLALEHLDAAADLFRALDYGGLEIDVDRVEVLLSAGLCTAAAELGLATARLAAGAGDHLHEAQLWLMCARAAFLDGDRADGAAYAERARRLFAAQGSQVWSHIARLEVVRAGEAPATVDELCAVARDLETAGHARGAATAVGLAALAAADSGDPAGAGALAQSCARHADRLGVFETRVLAALAQATAALAAADRSAARRHVEAGLSDLRGHRALLAAADARASVAIHADQLARLAVRMAVENGSAAELLRWTELARVGRRRHPAVRPVADAAAAVELARLRSVVAQVRTYEADGHSTVDLLQQQRDLERTVHRRSLRSARHVGAAGDWAGRHRDRAELAELPTLLCGRRLVELVGVDGRLLGVQVSAAGIRLTDLAASAAVTDLVGTVAAALPAALALEGTPARQSVARRSAARDLLSRAVTRLDELVGPALRGAAAIVLVVPPRLHAVPWQLLPSLAGTPLVLAPSATWWMDTEIRDQVTGQQVTGQQVTGQQVTGQQVTGQQEAAGPAGMPVAVAGPRLREAAAEARSIAACYPAATALVGPAATTTALTAAFADAATVHVASHCVVRRDNPLFSALELQDGPLNGYDIEALARTPTTVVLSGCETGVGLPAGDELLGLSTVFLDRGTRSLVASVCPLPDSAVTRDTMVELHIRLAAGADASAALADLAAAPWQSDGAMLAASLTCLGAR